jgi:hypothetical protein
MDYQKYDLLQTVAMCIGIVLVVATIVAGVVYNIDASNESETAIVEACVSNGGSWVAGPDGFECVQEGPR